MGTPATLKDDVVRIIRYLVSNPDAVELTETGGDGPTIYEVRVAPEDVGRVIGKNGRTAGARRIVLAAIGARSGRRLWLNVVMPPQDAEGAPASLRQGNKDHRRRGQHDEHPIEPGGIHRGGGLCTAPGGDVNKNLRPGIGTEPGEA